MNEFKSSFKEHVNGQLRGGSSKGAFRRLLSKPLQYRIYRYKITTLIIIINIVLFIVRMIFNKYGNVHVFDLTLAMNPVLFLNGRFWTVFTYMFVHGSFSHVFFNMLGLFFFGTVVERLWGSNEFILLYVLIGTLAGLFSFVVYYFTGSMGILLMGASGAVYGILLVFACLFPYQQVYIFGIFPVTAKILMLIFIGIQVLYAFTSSQGGIAYFTHLSGIGVAWLYLYFRHHINPYHRLLGR